MRTVDLFCGAGGSSWGARAAGAKIVAGFDACQRAGGAYSQNFPEAWFYENRLEDLRASDVAKELGPVNLLLASPECTSHSPAKGNAARSKASKDTAFEVVRFAEAMRPRWVVIENVVGMRRWYRYRSFIRQVERLGYHVAEQTLKASDYGVPQDRRRLFILCDLESPPQMPEPSLNCPPTVSSILEPVSRYNYTLLRSPRRASATLARADRAIAELGEAAPFLLVYYGSDAAGGWQTLDRPLRTITTLDRFAHVRPARGGHKMRMLQIPELKRAMGMTDGFSVANSTRRQGIRMIGNAVCPPVMTAVVKSLTR